MLKPGDKVMMNNRYYVSNKNINKIFIVKTEPQEISGTLCLV